MSSTPPPPPQPGIVMSPEFKAQLKATLMRWAVGLVIGGLTIYGGWKVMWVDIRDYWRQESVAKEKDDENARKLKEHADKDERDLAASTKDLKADIAKQSADLASYAKAADLGRSWVVSTVSRMNVRFAQQALIDCKKKNKTPEDCQREADDLDAAKHDADRAKDTAVNKSP